MWGGECIWGSQKEIQEAVGYPVLEPEDIAGGRVQESLVPGNQNSRVSAEVSRLESGSRASTMTLLARLQPRPWGLRTGSVYLSSEAWSRCRVSVARALHGHVSRPFGGGSCSVKGN